MKIDTLKPLAIFPLLAFICFFAGSGSMNGHGLVAQSAAPATTEQRLEINQEEVDGNTLQPPEKVMDAAGIRAGMVIDDPDSIKNRGGGASEAVQEGSNEEAIITKIIHDSFAWALTKDRGLFESLFAQDDDFFTYYPDSKNTVVGWTQFQKYLDKWMDPRNKALDFDIRDLKLVMAKTGNVAWFSAFVDDAGEWDGKPWGSKDVRWTGVLEKRQGRWVIVQQHMSLAVDKVLESYRKQE